MPFCISSGQFDVSGAKICQQAVIKDDILNESCLDMLSDSFGFNIAVILIINKEVLWMFFLK